MGNQYSYYYGLYLDGELVAKGTATELEKYYGDACRYLSKYARQKKKLYRMYDVKFEEKPKAVVINKKEKEKPLPYKCHVLNQLLKEGNSVISNKKTKDEILDYLTENGCQYKIRYVPARESLKEMWVVERC